MKEETQKLENKSWKGFRVRDLFLMRRGTRLIEQNRIGGSIPLATAGHENQGISDFINNSDQEVFSDSITIDMFGEAFYQKYKFCCDDNIHVLMPIKPIGKLAKLFVVMIINKGKYVFGYGKQYRSKTFNKQIIFLPTNETGNPDWQFMEDYMKNYEKKLIACYNKYLAEIKKSIKQGKEQTVFCWKEFSLNEIFSEIKRGKRLKKDDHFLGRTPYISSSGINNAVDNFIRNDKGVRIFSNCLTLANSGSVGACFFQPFSFVASDHVTKLENPRINKYSYLFISSIASRLGEKYSFNREINDERIRREKIMLPCTEKSEPDYKYMEYFMRNIEVKQLEKYLRYVEHKY